MEYIWWWWSWCWWPLWSQPNCRQNIPTFSVSLQKQQHQAAKRQQQPQQRGTMCCVCAVLFTNKRNKQTLLLLVLRRTSTAGVTNIAKTYCNGRVVYTSFWFPQYKMSISGSQLPNQPHGRQAGWQASRPHDVISIVYIAGAGIEKFSYCFLLLLRVDYCNKRMATVVLAKCANKELGLLGWLAGLVRICVNILKLNHTV